MPQTPTILCMAAMTLFPMAAQAIENERLSGLRQTFETELEKRLIPLKDEALRKLVVLENQRAIRGDYEGAIRARDRRLAITDRSGDEEEEGLEEEGAIELSMSEAQMSGNSILYDRRRDALVGFRKAGHTASWDVLGITPGWYSVLATYGCAEPFRARRVKDDPAAGDEERRSGGTFRFFEDTALMSDGSQPLEKTVTPTGGWDRLVKRNIGRLKITGNRTTLSLEVVEAENEGIMFLRKITLAPTFGPEEMGSFLPGGNDAPTKLRALREQYNNQVETITTPAIQIYIEALRKLEEEFTKAERLDEALASRGERERVEGRLPEPEPEGEVEDG